MKHMLTCTVRRIRRESGQAIVMTALMAGIFGIFGAFSIDVGLLLVDRRDAQSDVDKIALAGALELTLLPGPQSGSDAAIAAAQDWAVKNGVDTADAGVTLTVSIVNTCYSANDPVPTGVYVSLQRPPSTFLLGILPGVTDWTVRTSAIACAGRPVSMTGFLPFAISETGACYEPDGAGGFQPRLGEVCEVQVENSEQGAVGQLGFALNSTVCGDGNSSAAVLRENVDEGTTVTCTIGDSVSSNQGGNGGAVRQGLAERLATDGVCDANFNGSVANFNAGNAALNAATTTDLASPAIGNADDDFYQVWEYDPTADHPASGLVPFDCDPDASGVQTSPRNVALVVVRNYGAPDGSFNNSYIVRGFARAYLEGCERSGVFYKDCTQGGGPFVIYIRFVEQLGLTSAGLGLQNPYGDIEVFLKQ